MTAKTPSTTGVLSQTQFWVMPETGSFTRSVFVFAAAAVLISGLLIALTLNHLRTQAIESGERLTESFAQVIEEQTTRTFQSLNQTLQLTAVNLAQLQAAGRLTEDSARQLLRQELKSMPFVQMLWVTDAQGRLAYDSQMGNMGTDLSNTAYFKQLQSQPQTGFLVSPPVKSRSDGLWLIPTARALRSALCRRYVPGHDCRSGRPPLFRYTVALH